MQRKISAADGGQSLIQFTLIILVLMAFASLALDAGAGLATRRKLQNAADAAALAAARELCLGRDTETAKKTASTYLVNNGAMAIGAISSFGARSNDTYITSKVKARFIDANKFQANHVKVVTEAGTVFLLGLVTRREADEAVDIARTTGGVQKVVRLFEIIPEDEARRLDLTSSDSKTAPAK